MTVRFLFKIDPTPYVLLRNIFRQKSLLTQLIAATLPVWTDYFCNLLTLVESIVIRL